MSSATSMCLVNRIASLAIFLKINKKKQHASVVCFNNIKVTKKLVKWYNELKNNSIAVVRPILGLNLFINFGV
jgi:ribosomal protein S15P/S13E